MLLSELISESCGVELIRDAEVTGVTHDSRLVKPGYLFVAIRGFRADGHDFIQDAVDRGAGSVMVERGRAPDASSPGLAVASDTRSALAAVSSAFYGHPSRKLLMIGVTGTKGKTTTTHLIRHLLRRAGLETGLIGTVHNLVGDEVLPVIHTTPEAPELQALLASMVAARCSATVMEVSSHAIALRRVDGTAFDVAVLTNLGRDHLDFHRSFEDYLDTKKKLFKMLGEDHPGHPRERKFSVVNADDREATVFVSASPVRCVTYGLNRDATVTATDISLGSRSTVFTLGLPGFARRVCLPMPGRFNVYNALAAVSVGFGMGIDLDVMVSALESSQSVKGRAEVVNEGQDFTVLVDYAHTPDSLRNVLEMIGETSRGEIIAVFGCGGDRDPGKRPLMGKVAARLADRVILTSDNPRSEEPQAIIEDIETGVLDVIRAQDPDARLKEYLKIPDRFRAIETAIRMAGPGDVILIAGKGHESYQVFRDRVVPFDDVLVARQILKEYAGRQP